MCNRVDIVALLVTKGRADPQDRQRDTGTVALHEAAALGYLQCVRVGIFCSGNYTLSVVVHSPSSKPEAYSQPVAHMSSLAKPPQNSW